VTVVSAAVGMTALALAGAAHAQSNSLTDLGMVAPGLGINNSGQVVLQNYFYDNGTLTAFPANFTGAGINASGQVVGSVGLNCCGSGGNAGNGCAFATYAGGVVTTYPRYMGNLDPAVGKRSPEHECKRGDRRRLDILSGFGFSDRALSVSPSGAFLYTNGTMTDLGTLSGDTPSTGYAINSSGQIVGTCTSMEPTATRAFYWNGVMHDWRRRRR